MAHIDILANSAGLDEYSRKLLSLHSQLLTISKKIDAINAKLCDIDSVQWLGNGKEQFVAFFALLDRYASLIASEPINVEKIITNSALDEKNSEGTGWKHIQMLRESVKKFSEEAEKFSFYSANKANSILYLDKLNS